MKSIAKSLLVDPIVEQFRIIQLPDESASSKEEFLVNVLFKPGMTDNVAQSTHRELARWDMQIDSIGTCKKYWFGSSTPEEERELITQKLLANDSIERTTVGPLQLSTIALGSEYQFELKIVPILNATDDELMKISVDSLLSLSLDEMHTIRNYFKELDR